MFTWMMMYLSHHFTSQWNVKVISVNSPVHRWWQILLFLVFINIQFSLTLHIFIISSVTTEILGTKFRSDWTTDMTSRGSSCFWLTKFKENASGIMVLLKISNLFQNGCHCRQSFYITPYGLSPLLCYHWMLALMFIVWLFTIGNIVGFFSCCSQ